VSGLTRAAREALQRGDDEAAAALCRRALAQNGADTAAWALLGAALRRRDAAGAEAALRRAIDGDPANADARFHLANVLREQDRLAEAIGHYREALQRMPEHPSVLNNLGLAYAACGDDAAAEAAWRAVLVREPAHRHALANLAHLLCRQSRHREAAAVTDRYLAHHADAPAELWIDRGIAQHAAGDLDAAAGCFERALAIVPADATALTNLGSVQIDMGRFEAAASTLARAHDAAPDDVHVLGLLAHASAHNCDWRRIDAWHAAIAQRLARDAHAGINPFQALAMPLSAASQRQCARRWAASLAPHGSPAPAAIGARGTRLRVGYVSSDFREHAVAYLATEVWERHDRARLATFAYAIGVADRSETRRRIVAALGTFRDCAGEDAGRVAKRIRDDGIDVLVDLNGYTTHARSEIFAQRPARVQAHWLGYLGTLGAPWIDWVITDRYAAPPSLQQDFDERFLYLPDCYCPTDSRRPVAHDAGERDRHGLPAHGFVFCCFNNPYKLLPSVFDAWMRLLTAVPRSVLWLAPAAGAAAANLRREATLRGVDASRLVFAERAPLAMHLARHVHADLYLDTTPYNAGTAANDALFMGVPVLTCSGETMASRVAGSQLRAIGLPQLVTTKLADYEAAALALARDAARMRACKAELAANRTRFPLFDMARFTHALENALCALANGVATIPNAARDRRDDDSEASPGRV
jgi:predicted O-linked N-acetylglucosamine transferase (SPINDLY family)